MLYKKYYLIGKIRLQRTNAERTRKHGNDGCRVLGCKYCSDGCNADDDIRRACCNFLYNDEEYGYIPCY